MTTVLDICSQALTRINRLPLSQAAASGDAAVCLQALNLLIDSWANEELMIYTVTRTTWTITSGVADYNIGTGQTINVARPVSPQQIDRVNFYDSAITPTNELPLDLLTNAAWQSLGMKSLTAPYPVHAYYNPVYPTGILSLWMVPTSSTLRGVIYTPTRVSAFTALTDTVSLPPGYERMMVTNLALEISSSFGAVISPDMIDSARQSKAMVMQSNFRMVDQNMPTETLQFGAGGRTGYNIYSDSYH